MPIQLPADKQLLISIRRCSLKDIVQCYINGADVGRAVDSRNGDNPLHAAIRVIHPITNLLESSQIDKMVVRRQNHPSVVCQSRLVDDAKQ